MITPSPPFPAQLKIHYRQVFILIAVLSRTRTWVDEAAGGLLYCTYRLQ